MKLLILDDSKHVRSAIKKSVSLIKKVTSIFEATSIDEGIHIVNQHNPDIIILDLRLKTGTGIDFLKLLDRTYKLPLIILYSSYLSDEYIRIAKEYGVQYTLDKTANVLELIDLINSQINKSI